MATSAHDSDNQGVHRTEFCLLGPVSAWVSGEAVPVGGPRQAAVLARLMLTPRRLVSLDQFIDSIWDEQIPNRPEVAIRSYVSNLRRLLEPDRKNRMSLSSLVNASAGYRLDVDSNQIDWVRFENAVNDATGRLKVGGFKEAADSLRLAGDLWRGEPLSGVPESEFFLAHRSRLEELRSVAQELTYEAQLALGDHVSVAADIDRAVSANPFRERLTELGMVALYRSGRQSAALALGQQLRERLVDSLGIDPSPRIATIELQILNHDPVLREQAPPELVVAKPSSGQAVTLIDRDSGRGEATEVSPSGERSEHSSPSLIRRPSNDHLLFGRRTELDELDRLSERISRRLMAVAVITGEPGIGKTALMERAARETAVPFAQIVRCTGTSFAHPKFWLWRQVIDDIISPGILPNDGVKIRDTAGLEPLQVLGFTSDERGLKRDGSEVPRLSGSADDEAVMVAIGDFIDRVAAQGPLVILVDDLHLADQRSVDTLRYLVARPKRPPITVFMAWQQALLPPNAPHGLRELSVLPHGLRISLQGLDESAVRQLATSHGASLSLQEIKHIHRSAGGNPALTNELLAGGMPPKEQPVGSTPSMTDAVLAQVEQAGPDAALILSVAGVFDGPFALSWLQESIETPVEGGPQGQTIAAGRCRDVIRDSVFRGLVTELPEFGWFGFQHQVVRRALVETLLTVDRAWYHGHFGQRFLLAGDHGHALYHLARGSDETDRRQALDIGLRLCISVPQHVPIGDATLRTLETLAREQLQTSRKGGAESPLACRSALFLGWRANQRGDRATGRRWAHTAVEAALTRVRCDRKGKGRRPASAGALEDLGAAALNLTGFSPHPQPGGQLNVERDDSSLEFLEQVVSVLPNASETLPVLEIELEWLTGSRRPSNASLNKANNLLEQAIKSANASVAAMATTIFLRRFGRAIPAKRWIELVRNAVNVHTTIGERLMLAFLEHRAMLELGLADEATGLVRALGGESESVGSQADTAAARTLAIRHYLWTGDLQSAGTLLDRGPAGESAGADLVAVEVEQRAELGRLLARSDLLDSATTELGTSTVDPATCAALLSQSGHYERAAELLEQAVERIAAGRQQQVDEATLARIAVTANILMHKPAAATVLEPLTSLGDELLVSNNSAILLGPASFFAGLAAATVGSRHMADEALDAAVATALSKGGKPTAIQALVAQAKLAADHTERDDVESLLRQAKELAVGIDIQWLDKQIV